MTDTTQGNVILSRFTGKTYFGHSIDKFGDSTGNAMPVDYMKYHSDWNWIHEVLGKFRKLSLKNSFEWRSHLWNITESVSGNEIDHAFTALVEAVEWWNGVKEKEVV